MLRILLIILACLFAVPVAAEETADVRERLASRFPGAEAENVIATPIDGVYEITVGPVVLYVSEDGRYLFRGNLFDMKTDENLTEKREARARQRSLASLPDESLIIYEAEDPRYSITVFTDTSCGYCREFHSQIDDYLALGISVRYAFYPRNGMAGETWQIMEHVACADDRKAALTAAKQGKRIAAKSCEAPVMEHWQLGRMLGIRGTPAIFTSDGRMIPGYLPPRSLVKALQGKQAGG